MSAQRTDSTGGASTGLAATNGRGAPQRIQSTAGGAPKGFPRNPAGEGEGEVFHLPTVTEPGLQAYYAESWFTAEGARLKARRLQNAGLPDMRDWRFITLTIANRIITPYEAYLIGKKRLRRFLTRVRKALGRSFLWCWKLEFHEDGYPHWHMPLEYRKKIPREMLAEIEDWWGLGRIKIQRIKGRDIEYVFKYVAKGPDELPDWVRHHRGRIRVFQTSRGFYTKRKPRPAQKTEPMKCLVPVTLQTRLGWDERKAILVTENERGERRIRVLKLRMTFSELLAARAKEAIRKRVPMAAPGVVSISHGQLSLLQYEHRKWSGLARIPRNAAAA